MEDTPAAAHSGEVRPKSIRLKRGAKMATPQVPQAGVCGRSELDKTPACLCVLTRLGRLVVEATMGDIRIFYGTLMTQHLV